MISDRQGVGERLWFGLERGAPLSALAGGQPFVIALQHSIVDTPGSCVRLEDDDRHLRRLPRIATQIP
jgi:hypothetical protein